MCFVSLSEVIVSKIYLLSVILFSKCSLRPFVSWDNRDNLSFIAAQNWNFSISIFLCVFSGHRPSATKKTELFMAGPGLNPKYSGCLKNKNDHRSYERRLLNLLRTTNIDIDVTGFCSRGLFFSFQIINCMLFCTEIKDNWVWD